MLERFELYEFLKVFVYMSNRVCTIIQTIKYLLHFNIEIRDCYWITIIYDVLVTNKNCLEIIISVNFVILWVQYVKVIDYKIGTLSSFLRAMLLSV